MVLICPFPLSAQRRIEKKEEEEKKEKKGLRYSVKAAMELIVCFVVDYLSFTFKAFNLHLKYVEAVLQRLAKANLSLKLNKFKFGIFLVSRDFTEILSYRNIGTFHHCKYSSKSCQCTQYYILWTLMENSFLTQMQNWYVLQPHSWE